MKHLIRRFQQNSIPGFCGAQLIKIVEVDTIKQNACNVLYMPDAYLRGEFAGKRKEEAISALAYLAALRSMPKLVTIFSSKEDYKKFLYTAKKLLDPSLHREYRAVLAEMRKLNRGVYLPQEPLSSFHTEYKRIIVGDWVFLIPRKYLLPWGWHGKKKALSRAQMSYPKNIHSRNLHTYPMDSSTNLLPSTTTALEALDHRLRGSNNFRNFDFVYTMGMGITRCPTGNLNGRAGMMKFMMELAMSVPNKLQRDRNTWQWNGDLWICNALGHFNNKLHGSAIYQKGDPLPNRRFGGSTGVLISAAKEPPPVTVKYISL